MKKMIALTLLLAVSGVAGFLLYHGLLGRDDLSSAQPAPEFALPDLEGTPRSSHEWQGTVRVVNFWATWCPPCVREIPLLVDIQAAYGGRGVVVIGIAIDEPEAVARFAAGIAMNYPVLVGQEEAVELARAYADHFVGLPFTVFIDRADRVRHIHSGEIHRGEIEQILAELL